MISSFHGMIPSFHGMISSFHAVFVLRHRDKSAKVIDYNDQVIRVRIPTLWGISSPHVSSTEPFPTVPVRGVLSGVWT